jgi:hypothetical protein
MRSIGQGSDEADEVTSASRGDRPTCAGQPVSGHTAWKCGGGRRCDARERGDLLRHQWMWAVEKEVIVVVEIQARQTAGGLWAEGGGPVYV